MHISEGVLKPEILIYGVVATTIMISYSLKKLKNEEIPLVAVFSALFFLASFIHIPIGPVSIHLILNGIIGALLGIRASISIFIALLLQGLLFGYGGISTLGINTFNLAIPALLGCVILSLHINNKLLMKIQYFLVGFVPVFMSSIFLSITLTFNGESFLNAAKISFLAYIPIMLIEGITTMFIIIFLKKVYPQILNNLK